VAVSVLLPNTTLAVRRRVDGVEDAHGYRATASWGAAQGAGPGWAPEDVPGGQEPIRLRVDPLCWPVAEKDLIVEIGGAARQWTVRDALLLKHSIDPVVNYVRVEAFERAGLGTEAPDTPALAPPPASLMLAITAAREAEGTVA